MTDMANPSRVVILLDSPNLLSSIRNGLEHLKACGQAFEVWMLDGKDSDEIRSYTASSADSGGEAFMLISNGHTPWNDHVAASTDRMLAVYNASSDAPFALYNTPAQVHRYLERLSGLDDLFRLVTCYLRGEADCPMHNDHNSIPA